MEGKSKKQGKRALAPEESKRRIRYSLIFGIMAVVFLLLDFVSKWAVQLTLKEGELVTIIPNFLYVTLSYNTKVAFSAGFEGVGGRAINIIISVVMSSAFIAYYLYGRKNNRPFLQLCLALLSSGAVGNMIDRIFYWKKIAGFDGVIDWIAVYFAGGPAKEQTKVFPWNPFPIFNWADACLTVGVVLLIIYLICSSVQESKHKQEREEERKKKDAAALRASLQEEPKESNGIDAPKKADATRQGEKDGNAQD